MNIAYFYNDSATIVSCVIAQRNRKYWNIFLCKKHTLSGKTLIKNNKNN